MAPIIEIKNLGKKYNITHQQGGYVALRDVITNVFKNPFRFAKSKAKQIAGLEKKEIFWALNDVSFAVEPGEVIGIIGRNGAGKSTLLKILSQITPPTTGEIRVNGTLGSLLEVGTGFHPELSGRENIMLNGAILGMSKKEIVKKFDAIVEFAGIAKFLDTPVKYYSSGMYVRLAFSVAAHLEPDILLVDEVLAVGDAEFQNKCLGKMNEITKKEGRTILFVSHNLGAILSLCDKCVLLEKGAIKKVGKTDDVINEYTEKHLALTGSEQNLDEVRRSGSGKIKFVDIKLTDEDGMEIIKSHSKLLFTITYKKNIDQKIENLHTVISIFSQQTQQTVLILDSDLTKNSIREIHNNTGKIICETDAINLKAGLYSVKLDFSYQGESCDQVDDAIEFEVITDIAAYNYNFLPKKNIPTHLIKYNYKDAN